MLTWSGLLTVGQLSQASPTPSPSASFWSGLGTLLQLSAGFLIPAKQAKRTHQGSGASGYAAGSLLDVRGGKKPQGSCIHAIKQQFQFCVYFTHF